jgi:hypothetical protein
MVVRRLGGAGRALLSRQALSLPNLRRRASNSWAAVRDTFFSTKVGDPLALGQSIPNPVLADA